MTLQKFGGAAAIINGMTYIFGIVLFLIVLDPSSYEGAIGRLQFMIENDDLYVLGLLVSGFLFSFALAILVQAMHQRLIIHSPSLTTFTSFTGYFWAAIVLASAMIEVVSIRTLADLFASDPDRALAVYQSAAIIAGGLGGDIELMGALWTGLISYMGIRYRLFSRWLNYFGLAVGVAGCLTLLAFFSAFKGNPVFDLMTLIFGLGQIPWFIGLGVVLYRSPAPAERRPHTGLANSHH